MKKLIFMLLLLISFVGAAVYQEPWSSNQYGNQNNLSDMDWIFANHINVAGNITASMNWDNIQSFPAACPGSSAITQLGDSVICSDLWLDATGGNVTGNVNIDGNLTVNSLNVTSPDSITLAASTFENFGHETTIDENFMVVDNDQPTGFIGVRALNESVLNIAALVLEASGSPFNIFKNSPQSNYYPNYSAIVNDGSHSTMVGHDDTIGWGHYTTFDKDSWGNILNMTGIDMHMRLSHDNLSLLNIDLIVNGSVGIGVTNPLTKLDVAGSSTSGQSLQLRSGDIWNSATADSTQIIFSYDGRSYNSSGYGHSIKTRHGSGADTKNAIDFYLWNTDDGVNELGTNRVMSIRGDGRVGIGTDSPTALLDVVGKIKKSDALYNNIKTFQFDPNSVANIYTQYLGTFNSENGVVTIDIQDSGGWHGTSTQLKVGRQNIATTTVPATTSYQAMGGFKGYKIHSRVIDADTYELFFEDLQTNGGTIDYTVFITYQGTIESDIISASTDTDIIENNIGITIENDGNIGIGYKDAGGRKLYVNGEGAFSGGVSISNYVLIDEQGIAVNYGGGSALYPLHIVGKSFLDGNIEVTGNVGIGVSSPTVALDVVGFTNINDGTRNRLIIDATQSVLGDPDGRASFKASLTNAEIRLGNGIVFDAIESELGIPGTTYIGTDNSNARLYLEDNGMRFYDGTRDRTLIDSTTSSLVSPDGTQNFSVADSGVTVSGDLDVDGNLTTSGNVNVDTIISSNFKVNDGTRDRFKIEAGGITSYSPNGNSSIALEDTAYILNVDSVTRLIADGTSTTIHSPTISTSYLEISDVSITSNDGTYDRFIIDATKFEYVDAAGVGRILADADDITFVAPGGSSLISMDNAQLTYLTSAATRLNIDGTESKLLSPNGGSYFDLKNDSSTFSIDGATRIDLDQSDTSIHSPSGSGMIMRISDSDVVINDATRARLEITGSLSKLSSETGDAYFSASSTGAFIHDGTRNRIWAEDSDTSLFSPDGDLHVLVENLDFYVIDGARTRLQIKESGNTDITSANGGTIFTISDNDVYMTSTTGTFSPPYMTTTQRDALLVPSGIIHSNTNNRFEVYSNSEWLGLVGVDESGVLDVNGTGLFGWLGSAVNRITELFVVDINASGNVNVQGNITVTGDINTSTINGRSAKRTATFIGGVEGEFAVARTLTYGGTGTSNKGVTMPFAGKVTYMTLSVRQNTSLTCTLQVNGISSSDNISIVAGQTATATASTTFSAGDRVTLFKEGTTDADELIGTFFVEFDD